MHVRKQHQKHCIKIFYCPSYFGGIDNRLRIRNIINSRTNPSTTQMHRITRRLHHTHNRSFITTLYLLDAKGRRGIDTQSVSHLYTLTIPRKKYCTDFSCQACEISREVVQKKWDYFLGDFFFLLFSSTLYVLSLAVTLGLRVDY